MIRFINFMGGEMYVHESRVEEYKALGYALAPEAPAAVAEPIEERSEQAKPEGTKKQIAKKKK